MVSSSLSASVTPLEYLRPPKRTRRYGQGWLRILVLPFFFVCLALLLVYVYVRFDVELREQRAVAAIKSLGGRVVYGQRSWLPSPASATGRSWLRPVLSERFFHHVVGATYPPGIHDEDLKCLDDLPYLTSLGLNASAVTSAGLSQYIRKKRKLRSLHLRSTGITDADIATLAVLSDLQELDVSHTAITKRAVESLNRLSRLEWLRLEGTDITPDDAYPLDHAMVKYGRELTWSAAPCENQRAVAVALERRGVRIDVHQRRGSNGVEFGATLFQCKLQEEILNLLERLTVLKSLVLVDVSVSHSQWARIVGTSRSVDHQEGRKDDQIVAGLTRLEMLVIRNMSVADQDMTYIGKLTHLRVLHLRDGEVTDTGLAHLLHSLNRLEMLYLSEPQLTDASLASIAKLTGLRELEMKSRHLTDAGMSYVASLKKLETLMLIDTQVSDAGLVHLKHLKGLKSLWLRGAPITDAGLAHLMCLENLEYLNIENTSVTDTGLAHLTCLENLKHIDADSTKKE